MESTESKSRKRLTYEERVMIQHYWNDNKLSTAEIGRLLGRSQSTIWRELKKGATVNVNELSNDALLANKHGLLTYSATIAQQYKLSKHAVHGGARKLTFYWKTQIEEYLNDKGWSPEDFVSSFPKCPLSASTIRNYIRKGYIVVDRSAYGHSNHWSHKKPKNVSDREIMGHVMEKQLIDELDSNPVQVVKRLSIESRPASVETRRYFGHWEGDLVISRDHKKSSILVLVERKTRYTVILPIKNRTSVGMIRTIELFLSEYQNYVQSFTFDNGSEFISWQFLECIQVKYGKKTYFAHPYSPYERGTNEQRNRLIRVYAGYSDYDEMTPDDWFKIAEKLNHKPMVQALNGKTPYMLYHSETLRWDRRHKSN